MNYKLIFQLFGLTILLSTIACEKDTTGSNVPMEEGYLQLEVIVNPLIHPYAQTSFLNIEGVRLGDINTESIIPDEGLSFDAAVALEKVQLGRRQVLSPGGYTNLEIDFTASGSDACKVSSPVTTSDMLSSPAGAIHTLRADGSFLVENGLTTKQVLLLDLNRFLKTSEGGRVDFSFRENSTTASPRMQLFDPKRIGQVRGQVVRTEAAPRQTHRLITYAYEAGTFNQSQEIENGFSSAFISSIIRRNDRFYFPVLPEGAYELIVAHYVDTDQDGILEFKELLQADAAVRSNVRLARVSANASTSLELKLGGAVID